MGLSKENKNMEDVSVILRRFGDDDPSTLLDRFERLSFEVQLKQAILGRSLSESSVVKRSRLGRSPSESSVVKRSEAAPPQVSKGRGGSAFNWVMNKLLKPVFGKKGNSGKNTTNTNPLSFNAFSRSLRLR